MPFCPVEDSPAGQRQALEGEIRGTDRELARRQRALEALWLDRGEGTLDQETFEDLSRTFLLEKEGLTRQRQALEEALARLPDPEALAADRKARAEALARVPILTRDLAVGLVERILVSPRKEGTQEILLVWKF